MKYFYLASAFMQLWFVGHGWRNDNFAEFCSGSFSVALNVWLSRDLWRKLL
jgi:hypothetical protein